ncbi:MAG: substrate-binding domain-containing protein [Phycisphaerales bacterium]
MEAQDFKKLPDTIERLAIRLEKDIRLRGLVPGDKYLFAKDAANLLDVSMMKAHRAMKLLAERQILIRQPKAGTFIGPKFKCDESQAERRLNIIHIMMASDYHKTSHLSDKVFVEGVNKVLPHAAVQIHFVPEYDPIGYSEHIIKQVKTSSAKEGLVFIRSSKQVQQLVNDSDVLASVFGSVYPGIQKLPSVDVDQEQLGTIIAEYMLQKGFKRFAVLMHHEWRRGDNIMLNAITQKLGSEGIGLNCLDIYSLPCDRDVIAAEMESIIGVLTEPTGFICRDDFYAESLLQAMDKKNLSISDKIALISGGHLRKGERRSYPYIEPELDPQSQIEILVKMMCDLASGKQLDKMHYTVPIRIHEP